MGRSINMIVKLAIRLLANRQLATHLTYFPTPLPPPHTSPSAAGAVPHRPGAYRSCPATVPAARGR